MLRDGARTLVLASILAVASSAGASSGSALVAPSPLAPTFEEPTDAELERAWKRLKKEERLEVVEWFSAEAGALDTFQNRLLRSRMNALDRDPFDWPEADERPPLFDPKEHAPAQPIRRRFLSERAPKSKSWEKEVFDKVPERRLTSGWRYDYGSGQVVRLAPVDDPDRIFRNALAGFPPHLDLVEALVERELDDGSERDLLAAFGHAYSDRDGRAFTGVTLYDAWCSGQKIEMPDVECLAIMHVVLDDWRTFAAPVPKARQDELYDRIEQLFVRARRYRGLRHAFARCYLTGDAVLRDGYQAHLERLHGLWDRFESDPAKLAEDLPDPDAWTDWIDARGREVDSDRKAWAAALTRKATLEADAARVRATLIWVMRELGALE